jgi:hypothetical protein
MYGTWDAQACKGTSSDYGSKKYCATCLLTHFALDSLARTDTTDSSEPLSILRSPRQKKKVMGATSNHKHPQTYESHMFASGKT